MSGAPPTREEVLGRRRAAREERIACAAGWALRLPERLAVRGVAVFGSVARGDFGARSDIDVLVVAEHLPDSPIERILALGDLPDHVEPVVWTPAEYAARSPRDPIRTEACNLGVWVVGSPADAWPPT